MPSSLIALCSRRARTADLRLPQPHQRIGGRHLDRGCVARSRRLRSGWAVFGAVAIFLYVGAEVTIASVMINFLNRPDVLGLTLEAAGGVLAYYYWGGALVGRFVGSVLLTQIRASWLLTGAARRWPHA